MPIFAYFAVAGSVLVALLFVADATLAKRGPVVVSSEFYGLPKPWHPDPASPILAATPAPAPDMSSEAVLAAAPKVAPVPERTTQADAAPKKPKRVARKQPRPDDGMHAYAWSRNGHDGLFGGGNSMFGRF